MQSLSQSLIGKYIYTKQLLVVGRRFRACRKCALSRNLLMRRLLNAGNEDIDTCFPCVCGCMLMPNVKKCYIICKNSTFSSIWSVFVMPGPGFAAKYVLPNQLAKSFQKRFRSICLRFSSFLMHLHPIVTHIKRYIGRMKKIVSEILLN